MKRTASEELQCIFNKVQKYHVKILLGDFSTKVRREDIFKPTIQNDSLHKISNANRVIVVTFPCPKICQEPQCSLTITFIKLLQTFPDGNIHNLINYILKART
jgi:hypothetical protein